jgi:hypothetical protein
MWIEWKAAGVILAAGSLGLGAALRPAPGAPADRKTVAALQAEVEALRPAKLAWREIAWKNCPLEALKEARERRRPVLAWVFLGHPADERC